MIATFHNVGNAHSIVLTVISAATLLFGVNVSIGADTGQSPDETTLIVDSFEEPLRIELLKKGYSPRNAAVTSQNLVRAFAECWISDRNKTSGSEQETVVVQLGGQTIVTYESPCLTEFLGDIEGLP